MGFSVGGLGGRFLQGLGLKTKMNRRVFSGKLVLELGIWRNQACILVVGGC